VPIKKEVKFKKTRGNKVSQDLNFQMVVFENKKTAHHKDGHRLGTIYEEKLVMP
jgi:hypothetical protein